MAPRRDRVAVLIERVGVSDPQPVEAAEQLGVLGTERRPALEGAAAAGPHGVLADVGRTEQLRLPSGRGQQVRVRRRQLRFANAGEVRQPREALGGDVLSGASVLLMDMPSGGLGQQPAVLPEPGRQHASAGLLPVQVQEALAHPRGQRPDRRRPGTAATGPARSLRRAGRPGRASGSRPAPGSVRRRAAWAASGHATSAPPLGSAARPATARGSRRLWRRPARGPGLPRRPEPLRSLRRRAAPV